MNIFLKECDLFNLVLEKKKYKLKEFIELEIL